MGQAAGPCCRARPRSLAVANPGNRQLMVTSPEMLMLVSVHRNTFSLIPCHMLAAPQFRLPRALPQPQHLQGWGTHSLGQQCQHLTTLDKKKGKGDFGSLKVLVQALKACQEMVLSVSEDRCFSSWAVGRQSPQDLGIIESCPMQPGSCHPCWNRLPGQRWKVEAPKLARLHP